MVEISDGASERIERFEEKLTPEMMWEYAF
jgi:hypothetical protein